MLDLGCGDGSVAEWIEKEFPDAVVFTLDRVSEKAMLKVDITPHMLELLSRLEYFSVVLALNFLHHFAEQDWQKAVEAVTRIGRRVVIQLPPVGDYRAAGAGIMAKLHQAVESAGGVRLGEAWYEPFKHDRPLWLISNNEDKQVDSSRPWVVSADESTITKTRLGFSRSWVPGMNLWNMIGLGCDRQWAYSLVESFKLPEREHGDIYPWNFICDGEHLHLIDPQYEPGGHWSYSDKDGLANTLKIIKEWPNEDWREP